MPIPKNFVSDTQSEAIKIAQASLFEQMFKAFAANHHASLDQFKDLEMAKEKATALRKRVISSLDTFLVEFETKFLKKGAKIIWANDSDEARKEILHLLKQGGDSDVMVSDSMVMRELEIDEAFKTAGINYNYTAAEYNILNENKVEARHPVFHLAGESLANFTSLSAIDELKDDRRWQEYVAKNEKLYRNNVIESSVFVGSADFICADTGSICIMEQGGGAIQTLSLATQRIIVAGIEQLIPSLNDLFLFIPLYSSFALGKNAPAQVMILDGNKNEDPDWQTNLTLVLIDNGRSKLLANAIQRQILQHIGVEAWINFDPIFRLIGYKSYQHAYPGVLGNVLSTHINAGSDRHWAAGLSTLDGFTEQNGPLQLQLRESVIASREEQAHHEKTESDFIWRTWRNGMTSRKFLDRSNLGLLSLMKSFFKRGWEDDKRVFPKQAKLSFHDQWLRDRPEVVKSNKLIEIPKGQLLVRKPANEGRDTEN